MANPRRSAASRFLLRIRTGLFAGVRDAPVTPPKSPAAQLQPPSHEVQRRHIMQALHRCIRRNGYAFTSLRDLAEEAGMSASHVRYYFESKDAVLEHYLEHLIEGLRNDINEIALLPVEERVAAIADRFFGEGVTRDRISVLFEIFGTAIHNKRLHRLKVAYDAQLLDIIQRTLADARGVASKVVEDDAVTLYALLVGLCTNLLFGKKQALASGRRLFVRRFDELAWPHKAVRHDTAEL